MDNYLSIQKLIMIDGNITYYPIYEFQKILFNTKICYKILFKF